MVYAPKGFLQKLQFEFHQRWWEMYLTIGLCRLGFKINTFPRDDRPDLLVEIGGLRNWFEAVAPKPGNTSDQVPDPILNDVCDHPERECLLRLLQAIKSKHSFLTKYLTKVPPVVLPQDACVIALSACNLNQLGSSLNYPGPAPLKILAGAGNLVIPLDRSRQPYLRRRNAIFRDSGSPVESNLFEKEEYSIISAVLYSDCDPLNAPDLPESTFKLFLNPLAKINLPKEICERIPTWWAEDILSKEIIWKTQ